MDSQDKLRAAMMTLWKASRPGVLARVETLEGAVQALAEGGLTEASRQVAEGEAHKLAGSLGTFGLHRGSVLAAEAERRFAEGGGDLGRLVGVVEALRAEVERGPAAPGPVAATSPDPLVLVADADEGWAEAIVAAAAEAGWRAVRVTSQAAAEAAIGQERPAAAVVDVAFTAAPEGGRTLAAELAYGARPAPVLVLGPEADLQTRLQIARGGAAAFLARPQTPQRVVEAMLSLVEEGREETRGRVLAVDDDPAVLEAVRVLLSAAGLELTAVADAEAFWAALEASPPDLVLLDIGLPGVDGIELCQVLRNDPRWRSLPLIFLTARADPQTLHRVFALGADDFVAKPIVGPELTTRVQNRLDRIRLLRRLAEVDALTGIANRQKGRQVLEHFLGLAARQGRPLSLAVLDVDHFKKVNDTHGHDAGDRVLRRLGGLLRGALRGEDVVARWGGEEFVVGMFGATKAQAVGRLEAALERLRAEAFDGPEGPFSVSFSAGVAEFPADGPDVPALFAAADAGLYAAKHAGRNRVLPVG